MKTKDGRKTKRKDEVEDEIFLEDDLDILDIIDFDFHEEFIENPITLKKWMILDFFRRFRLTKEAAISVLELIEHRREFENDLNNSVSPINQLLTALLFYSSSAHQINTGDIMMQMNQSTVSRIVKKVSEALATLRNRFIKLPGTPQEILTCQNDFYQLVHFPCVIGCVDGTHVKVLSLGGEDGEVYRNRKSYFSIIVQLVCNSSLEINNVVARWPGSTHDSTIFNNSRLRIRFEADEFGNGILLGDSGYPLKSYLLTHFQNPHTRAKQLYNEAHIRTRNTIERTNGVWKRLFPVLCYGLRCNIQTALTVIVATAVLHNIAINMHEDMPPPPEGMNAEELDYLIQQGQIPIIHPQENVNYDFRNDI